MSFRQLLKPSCTGCGSTTDLYGSNCKHLILCLTCGKTLVKNRGHCFKCGIIVSRLIREYAVKACSNIDKNFFIAKFVAGLPNFSKKKSSENQWTLQKEGLLGRQVTDTLREKYKNKPCLLKGEMSQSQYHGRPEGAQSATYNLLIREGKDFFAIPASSWYNFNKVTQYKQLTLEEAEEKMKNRRRSADGYERWMMKAANNGPAAFGESNEVLDIEADTCTSGGRGRKKSGEDEGENASDKGEEDEYEDEETPIRKSRLGLNKKGVDNDDGEGRRGGDLDDDDIDIEKGHDWEHEEIFSDDDEAVGNDPEEEEDLAPAPPEIKQDAEEDRRLSKSGKELKKLLGRTNEMNGSDREDDNDSDDAEEEDGSFPVLAPKMKDGPKEEPSDSSRVRAAAGKGKRKINGDDRKVGRGAQKKVKAENEQKGSVKEKAAQKGSSCPVSEDEIRAVLLQRASVTIQDLLSRFNARLRSAKDKKAFSAILKRLVNISKTKEQSYIVLKDR